MPRERSVELDGLPESEAVALLRDHLAQSDRDGARGLRDASELDLQELARRCNSVPRALDAVAGIFDRDLTLTLAELLANTPLFTDRVVENLIAEQYRRLVPAERRVLEALAVLDAPVTMEPVEHLLKSFCPNLELRSILTRLLQVYLVRIGAPPSEGKGHEVLATGKQAAPTPLRYHLHPMDQRFAYAQIPDRVPLGRRMLMRRGYAKPVLHALAAKYYCQQALPIRDCKTRDQLEPLLCAFEHLVLAHQYEKAFLLLEEFDFTCLWLWGYCDEVVRLRERLQGRLRQRRLQAINCGNLGLAYWSAGQPERALAAYDEALRLSTDQHHQRAAWLGNKGLALYAVGDLQVALCCLEDAIALDHRLGDEKLEGTHRCDIGIVHRGLGRTEEAVQNIEQGMELSRGVTDRRVEVSQLANLGWCHLILEDISLATSCFRQGLTLSVEINSALGKCYNAIGMAICHLLAAEHDLALEQARQAYEADHPLGRHYACLLLGLVHVGLGAPCEAREMFEETVQRCDVLIGHTAQP